MLRDGRYDAIVIDAHEVPDAPDGVRLELAVTTGPHKGDVLAVRARVPGRAGVDLLGLPVTITVTGDERRVVFEGARWRGPTSSERSPMSQPPDGDQAAAGAPQPVPVNMYEAQQALVIVAPLPGVMADDVEVTVVGRSVTIAAAMRTSAPKDYVLHEWHYGPYERQVEIPEGFGGKAEATFANGQLALRITRADDTGELRVVTPSMPSS